MKKLTIVVMSSVLLVGAVGVALTLNPKAKVVHASSFVLPKTPISDHILEPAVQPIPQDIPLDGRKVALGRVLFLDKRLSHDNTISCASCHDLAKGGTDQLAHSLGINGAVGGVNAPTVLNSGFNYKQFWNGRSATLEDQVNGPTHNPKEMGSDWPEIVGKLKQDSDLTAQFGQIYPDGIGPDNVRDAIATFERSLYTPNCRFDKYLRGDKTALDADEIKGYGLFRDYGCISCHQGQNVGGNMFQKLGIMHDYFADRGHETSDDQGRFAVTGREADRHVFRVPSLRNVELTAPYFHDGTATTLPEAVEQMAKYQVGRPLEPDDLVPLVKFLHTLTGEAKDGAK